MHAGWCKPGSPEAGKALARFDQEFPLGGTDLAAGFGQAVREFEKTSPPRRRVVVYLGDGEDKTHKNEAPARRRSGCGPARR